jgi:hypothetical protein
VLARTGIRFEGEWPETRRTHCASADAAPHRFGRVSFVDSKGRLHPDRGMDYILLRRTDAKLAASDAQTLFALWPLLPLVTIADLKSIGCLYGKGDLDRLWGYAHRYYAAEHASLAERSNLAALLLVPGRTPTLDADVEEMRLAWEDLGTGYWRVTGGPFALYVVEIDRVADQPDEDLLALYSRHEVRTPRALRFWDELMGA